MIRPQHVDTWKLNKCTFKVSVDTILCWSYTKNVKKWYFVNARLWSHLAPYSLKTVKATQNLSTFTRSSSQEEYKQLSPIKIWLKIKKMRYLEKVQFWPPSAPNSSETVRAMQNLSTYYRKIRSRGIQRNKFH